MRTVAVSLSFLVILSTCSKAAADIIYDNGGPNQTFIYYSQIHNSPVGPQIVADQVNLQSDALLSGAHWWGGYFPSDNIPNDNFVMRIYDTAAGLPGNLLHEVSIDANRQQTGETVGGVHEWEYWSSFDPIALDAGTQYFFSVENSHDEPDEVWFWAAGPDDGSGFAYSSVGNSWLVESGFGELAFYLTGTSIPEPGQTIAILVASALFAIRCRQKIDH